MTGRVSGVRLWGLLVVLAGAASTGIAGEVRIYNWLQYLPKEILQDFEHESGIKPVYVEFDSAQELENKLLTGNSGYDVAFPGSASLRKLIVANALQPLRRDALSNWQHLDGAFMQSLEAAGDQGNRYAVPYLWGATVFGYDAEKLETLFAGEVPSSWALLFEPANARKLAGCSIGIIDAPDEILPIALNYLGLDPNSRERGDYRAAQQLMQRLRPAVRYFALRALWRRSGQRQPLFRCWLVGWFRAGPADGRERRAHAAPEHGGARGGRSVLVRCDGGAPARRRTRPRRMPSSISFCDLM